MEDVYHKLQKHLNCQPVGFPATKSGSEIRILKNIFSSQEAEIAAYLSYKFESIETIFNRDWFFSHLIQKKLSLFVHVAGAVAVCSIFI